MPRKRSSSTPARLRRGESAGRDLVREWTASGLSQAAYARRRGISAQRLGYWRLRLGEHPTVAAPTDSIFVEIPQVTSPAPTGIDHLVVEFRDGFRVRVERGFDPALLRAIVAALKDVVTPC